MTGLLLNLNFAATAASFNSFSRTSKTSKKGVVWPNLCHLYKSNNWSLLSSLKDTHEALYLKIAYDKQIKLSQIEIIKKLKEQEIINKNKYLELLMNPSKLKDILSKHDINKTHILHINIAI